MTQVQRFSPGQNRWIVAALWLFLYGSFALLSPSLLDGADSLHAEIAREMVVRGDPVTLYADGIRSLEKAPLLYWSMAGSMRAFGVGAAQARLPLAVYALLLFLVVEAFARRAFGSVRAGLYAAVSLQLSVGLFLFTRTLIPDVMVALWYAAAVLCLWQMEWSPGERNGDAPVLPCAGFAAACALNVLTAGLVGLSVSVGTLLIYLLLTRGWRGMLRRIGQLHPVLAGLIFLLIAAPWHVLAAEANPAEGYPPPLTHAGHLLPWFWRGWHVAPPSMGNIHGWAWVYFGGQHLLQQMNLGMPRDDGTVPLLLFWALILVWLMPWSAFLFKALGALPWSRTAHAEGCSREEKTALLLAVAALAPLMFCTFSTRHEYDVLPSLPFLAMLIGQWLDREANEVEAMTVPAHLGEAGQRIASVLLALAVAAALVCGCILLIAKSPDPHADLAALLKHRPDAGLLYFGPFLNLTMATMGALRGPLLLAVVAFSGGAVINWHLRRSYRPDMGNVALAAASLLCLTACHVALNTFSPVLSSQKLVAAIAPILSPKNLVVINGEYEAASTLGFYLQRSDLHILHGHSGNLWYGSFSRDAPPIFETDESFRRKWLGPERIFLWTDPVKLPTLPSKAYIVAEDGGKQIVSNKASQY